MKLTDYLACPNCGNGLTGAELCNLGCRREWEEKQQSKTRAAKHARMRGLFTTFATSHLSQSLWMLLVIETTNSLAEKPKKTMGAVR